MRVLFEQEYKKIEKSLFLVAIGYLHNSEDAKDVMQEAALSAYQNFSKLKYAEYFKTWMTRIVINKSKDFLKKQRYTEELTDTLHIFYDLPTADLEIMDAVCKLDRKMSVYITLRFYNDMTYKETAQLLKQPVSTVKYRTQLAMEKLKNLLEGGL